MTRQPDIYPSLNEEFDFQLIAEPTDLSRDWDALRVYVSAQVIGSYVEAWVRKAFEASRQGATVVALLPARTATNWFHDWVVGRAEIRFFRGRRWVDGLDAAMVCIWRAR